MAKITQAEIKELREAKKLLDALSASVKGDANANEYLQSIGSSAVGFGSGSKALDGHADELTTFVDARWKKIGEALGRANGGVSTAAFLLDKTITNYENNEKTHTDAANGTPAGRSRTNGSGGSSGNMEGS